MKKRLLIALLAGLTFTACTDSASSLAPQTTYQAPSQAKMDAFTPVMTKVALSTREDPKYNRMALNTPEEKEWFKMLMYRLWDRQITRSQFIAEGVSRYPTHRYEFNFIANGFQHNS